MRYFPVAAAVQDSSRYHWREISARAGYRAEWLVNLCRVGKTEIVFSRSVTTAVFSGHLIFDDVLVIGDGK